LREALGVERIEVGIAEGAGVVDEDVEPAEFFMRGFDQLLRALDCGEVGFDEMALAHQGTEGLGRAVRNMGIDHEARALAGKCFGNREAYSLRPAGHADAGQRHLFP
jgi:hypothetical protein